MLGKVVLGGIFGSVATIAYRNVKQKLAAINENEKASRPRLKNGKFAKNISVEKRVRSQGTISEVRKLLLKTYEPNKRM